MKFNDNRYLALVGDLHYKHYRFSLKNITHINKQQYDTEQLTYIWLYVSLKKGNFGEIPKARDAAR